MGAHALVRGGPRPFRRQWRTTIDAVRCVRTTSGRSSGPCSARGFWRPPVVQAHQAAWAPTLTPRSDRCGGRRPVHLFPETVNLLRRLQPLRVEPTAPVFPHTRGGGRRRGGSSPRSTPEVLGRGTARVSDESAVRLAVLWAGQPTAVIHKTPRACRAPHWHTQRISSPCPARAKRRCTSPTAFWRRACAVASPAPG